MAEDIQQVECQRLDHLGLIAGICRKIDLVKQIDKILPKTRGGVKISNGEAILAMILNGLGFKERRLYLTAHFYKDKAVKQIFGETFSIQNLNEDVLGRALDAVFEYGPTKLFSDIAFKTAWDLDLISKVQHLDTTSISFSGRFKKQNPDGVNITYGHSKDKRVDLPQLVLSLITDHTSNLPLYAETHSGNENDRDIMPKVIEQFEFFKNKNNYNKDFIYVADSSLYSKKYLLNSTQTLDWITRVPESVLSATSLLTKHKNEFEWEEIDNNYKITSVSHAHGGIKQRWVMVYSRVAHYKEVTTLKKRIKKEEGFIFGRIKSLKNKKFHCEEEIKTRVETLRTNHPLFKFEYFTKREILRKNISGKRKTTAVYRAEIQFYQNKYQLEKLVNKKGRFILATNNKSNDTLSNQQIFTYYKGQNKVESCFKFIKDKSFLIKDFYLKKPERIQALMAVMSLTLFIYNLGQFLMRKSLADNKIKIPNQKGTLISNPTLKWAFQLMQGINWVKVKVGEKIYSHLSSLSEIQTSIINAICEATHIYGFS